MRQALRAAAFGGAVLVVAATLTHICDGYQLLLCAAAVLLVVLLPAWLIRFEAEPEATVDEMGHEEPPGVDSK